MFKYVMSLALALSALAFPAAAEQATKVGSAHLPTCGPGGFVDLKGDCWTCPAGFQHDNPLLPPTDGRVCRKPGVADNRTGTRIGPSVAGICSSGWLSVHDLGCYTCPQGYSHNLALSGNQPGVCHRSGDAFSAASHLPGNAVCSSGFFDPIDNGSCWTCPPSAPVRSIFSVRSDQACQPRACGAQGERPCMVTERIPSCNSGLMEDVINNRCVHPDLKAAVCTATVAAVKGGRSLATFAQAFATSHARTDAQRRLLSDKRNRDMFMAQAENVVLAHLHRVPELRRITELVKANPDAYRALFDPEALCSATAAQRDARLAALGLRPNFPRPASGGSGTAPPPPDEHFFMGYQLGVSAAAVAGMQVSLLFVTDFRGGGGVFVAVGPQLVSNLVVSGSTGPQFFPKVSADSFTGWGYGAAVSAGTPIAKIGLGLDLSFGDPIGAPVGFGLSGSAGVDALPGDLGVGATFGWRLD